MSDNEGRPARAGGPQLIRLNLKLPYTDLALTDKAGGAAELDDSAFGLALVLPYGIGPNEPRLIQVDDSGNQKVVGPVTAALLAGLSAVGAQLFIPPSEWSITHAPAAGAQATISRAAGAVGVRHIARRISFGFSSQAALAGVAALKFTLNDGATGAGTVLKSWTFDLPAAIIPPFAISFEDNSIGSGATAMTLEMVAAVAGLRAFVNLGGVDAS